MGMPNVSISFTEAASTAVTRGDRGIIGMILKDKTYKNQTKEYITAADIPTNMLTANKQQIELALRGYENAPKKVVVYFIDPEAAADYSKALNYFEINKFNYLVAPSVETDKKTSDVVNFIKKLRENGKMVKAILPNTAADNEGIINYTTASVTEGDTVYTTEQFCSRIAGIIAGTPLRISCTYAPLSELTDCTKLTRTEMDTAINNGEFIVWWDGEKVKTGRAVTSLKTTTSTKGSKFKKIKIVDTIDMIYEDIKKTAEDTYLGKFENSYDNKGLLVSAIMGYFDTLKRENVLGSYSVDIDVEANRNYLAAKGGKIKIDGGEEKELEDCTDIDIKKADTDEHVFITAQIQIYDAIEDITISIAI